MESENRQYNHDGEALSFETHHQGQLSSQDTEGGIPKAPGYLWFQMQRYPTNNLGVFLNTFLNVICLLDLPLRKIQVEIRTRKNTFILTEHPSKHTQISTFSELNSTIDRSRSDIRKTCPRRWRIHPCLYKETLTVSIHPQHSYKMQNTATASNIYSESTDIEPGYLERTGGNFGNELTWPRPIPPTLRCRTKLQAPQLLQILKGIYSQLPEPNKTLKSLDLDSTPTHHFKPTLQELSQFFSQTFLLIPPTILFGPAFGPQRLTDCASLWYRTVSGGNRFHERKCLYGAVEVRADCTWRHIRRDTRGLQCEGYK